MICLRGGRTWHPNYKRRKDVTEVMGYGAGKIRFSQEEIFLRKLNSVRARYISSFLGRKILRNIGINGLKIIRLLGLT